MVEFSEKTGSKIHRLHIIKEPTDFTIRESCSATDHQIASQYKFIQYQTIP